MVHLDGNSSNACLYAERIVNRRKSMKLKQYELAEKIGISTTHMCAIENGRDKLTIDVLLKLCEVLDVSTDYILAGTSAGNNSLERLNQTLKLCSEDDLEFLQIVAEGLIRRDMEKKKSKMTNDILFNYKQ